MINYNFVYEFINKLENFKINFVFNDIYEILILG